MQKELDTKLDRANNRLMDFPVGVYDERGLKDIVKNEVNSFLGRSISDFKPADTFTQSVLSYNSSRRPSQERLLQLEAKQKQQLESVRSMQQRTYNETIF